MNTLHLLEFDQTFDFPQDWDNPILFELERHPIFCVDWHRVLFQLVDVSENRLTVVLWNDFIEVGLHNSLCALVEYTVVLSAFPLLRIWRYIKLVSWFLLSFDWFGSQLNWGNFVTFEISHVLRFTNKEQEQWMTWFFQASLFFHITFSYLILSGFQYDVHPIFFDCHSILQSTKTYLGSPFQYLILQQYFLDYDFIAYSP